MASFLNKFAAEARSYDEQDLDPIFSGFDWFMGQISGEYWVEDMAALQTEHGRPLIALLEAAFVASVSHRETVDDYSIPRGFFAELSADEQFRTFTDNRPTDRQNVAGRLKRATEYLAENLNRES